MWCLAVRKGERVLSEGDIGSGAVVPIVDTLAFDVGDRMGVALRTLLVPGELFVRKGVAFFVIWCVLSDGTPINSEPQTF